MKTDIRCCDNCDYWKPKANIVGHCRHPYNVKKYGYEKPTKRGDWCPGWAIAQGELKK